MFPGTFLGSRPMRRSAFVSMVLFAGLCACGKPADISPQASWQRHTDGVVVTPEGGDFRRVLLRLREQRVVAHTFELR
jgi:hypothetical protein